MDPVVDILLLLALLLALLNIHRRRLPGPVIGKDPVLARLLEPGIIPPIKFPREGSYMDEDSMSERE